MLPIYVTLSIPIILRKLHIIQMTDSYAIHMVVIYKFCYNTNVALLTPALMYNMLHMDMNFVFVCLYRPHPHPGGIAR